MTGCSLQGVCVCERVKISRNYLAQNLKTVKLRINLNHNVVVELDSIFASAKHQESGFNRAWQDEFLWLLFTFYHRVCSEN